MSWIYNTFFSWLDKVDEYRNNWGKNQIPTEAKSCEEKEIAIRFSSIDSETVDFAKETDLMIADLLPPLSKIQNKGIFNNKYYVSWHSLKDDNDTPGVPGINMFDDFGQATEEFEKMLNAPFGKSFIIILWASNDETLQKLQLGGVKNYTDYKNNLKNINDWIKKNIYSAKLFGESRTIEDL